MSGYTIMSEEEIKEMVNTCNCYHSCACCPYNPEDISRFIGDKWKGGCPNYDRKLVYAMGQGYGDLSRCKAEIERLRQQIRDTDRMARNSIEQYKNDYDKAFERLKAQQQEIDALKAENKQLKTECALLDDELRISRQETINVLNKLKGNIKSAIDTYFNKDGGGYYLAEDVINDIDELIKELIKNAEDKS